MRSFYISHNHYASLSSTTMDVRFKVPANFYISGQSQCGKSYLVRKLLHHLKELFHPTPSKVIYCYGEYQKEFDELHGVDFVEGFPTDLSQLTQGHEQTLLILEKRHIAYAQK